MFFDFSVQKLIGMASASLFCLLPSIFAFLVIYGFFVFGLGDPDFFLLQLDTIMIKMRLGGLKSKNCILTTCNWYVGCCCSCFLTFLLVLQKLAYMFFGKQFFKIFYVPHYSFPSI